MQSAPRFVTLGRVRRALFAWCVVVLCASDAAAFTLRVLAPTELRVAPSVRADRSGVTFSVVLRDDQGAPVAGPVRLDVRRSSANAQRAVTTDIAGRAAADVAVGRDDRVLQVRAQFAGDATHAPSSSELSVDLDAPFVTVVLQSAPSAVDVEARSALELVASVEIGRVALASPVGWPVRFYMDDEPLGTASADATGRAAIRVDPSRFSTPGVRTLRAAAQLRGSELWSNERRIVVRALTSVVATPARDERTGQLHVRGAVAWRGGGVAGATVRVESNQTLVTAALTDGSGAFELTVPPRSQLPGARARIVFVPTTPWLSGSESAEFYLAPPALPPVSWRFALAPLAIGALVFLLARARSNKPVTTAAQTLDEGVVLEESATGDQGSVLTVIVEDRSSGEPLGDFEVLVGDVVIDSATPHPVSVGAKLSITVRAAGYASREVSVVVRRSGALRLRVALSQWREAVYGVGRALMDATSGPKAPPTLREASEQATAAHKPVFAAVEEGAYGPDDPSESTFDRVRDLARSSKQREH